MIIPGTMATETKKKRGRPALTEPYRCVCNYNTMHLTDMTRHKAKCKLHQNSVQEDKQHERIQELEQQLKQQSIENEMQRKDDKIEMLEQLLKELAGRPVNNSTVNNGTMNNVINNINVFGDRSHSLSDKTLHDLIKDPMTSITGLIGLRLQDPEYQNIEIPNSRDRKRARILIEENGVKKWKLVNTDDIMYDMWDDNRGILEPIVDESSHVGQRWHEWANSVDDSFERKGEKWKEQAESMKNTIISATRV